MIIVKNSLCELDKIYHAVFNLAEMHGLSQEVQNDLCICIDEVFSNIIKYAYEDFEEHEIKIDFNYNEHSKKITVVMVDDGKPFNPLNAKVPDLSINLLEREVGGLGVFIVLNIMSSVSYSRLNNTNMLEMIKDVV